MVDPGELGAGDDILEGHHLLHEKIHFLLGEIGNMLFNQGVCRGPQDSQIVHLIRFQVDLRGLKRPLVYIKVVGNEFSNVF